jgi:hypothetical protein
MNLGLVIGLSVSEPAQAKLIYPERMTTERGTFAGVRHC